MATAPNPDRARLQQQLRASGLRVTAPRLAALAWLNDHPHATADQVAGGVRELLGSVSTQAVYAVLSADADEPRTWLRAGEALSAVLLTAVVLDLAVSPMSDVAEVPATRALLRGLLAGIGYPLLVLRVGVAEPNVPVAATPRRSAADAVRVDP